MRPLDLGKSGEAEAAKLLSSRGYQVLEANWRCSLGEIDLVLRKGDCLVFAEVKTRRTGTGFDPETGVTAAKAARLRRLARAYLARHPWFADMECRFDVVCVRVTDSGMNLDIIEGAFT